MRRGPILPVLVLSLGLIPLLPDAAHAYIEAPMSLGAVINQSSHVMLVRVESVDREKNFIIYRKVRDIKGVHPQEIIKHNIGRGGLRPNEWKPTMDWAQPGKIACFFYNGGASEMCIGNWWYQAYAGGEWWNHSHAEPFLLRSYAGPPEKLGTIVADMLAGKEVVVPCMVDGNKDDLHNRRAKIQRVRASLKLQDYNPKRDFVGWGGEDFRRLAGMPGFTHVASLGRVDPQAQAISSVDVEGKGKLDVTLVGGDRTVVLQNGGDALSELALPGATGARAGLWADYDADGKPDLLLACPTGPRLFANLGGGEFRDDTAVIPSLPFWQATAAAWIDHDRDGLPDLLVANGLHGLRLFRNNGTIVVQKTPGVPQFGPWHFLGPIENTGNRAFTTPHPVEKSVDLQAVWPGRGGQKIGWKKGNFSDGQINDLKLFGQFNENSAVYLYRTIDCDASVDIPVSLGSDDTLQVWLNGTKIVSSNLQRAAAPDQERTTLKLRPGTNHLLLQIGQGNGDWAFYFRAEKFRTAPPRGLAFTDISEEVGLGPKGLLAGEKASFLSVADFLGEDHPAVLVGTGRGRLLRPVHQEKGFPRFVEMKETGLDFAAKDIGPAVGDFDGDGLPDLFVPQKGTSKLLRNLGKGKFHDVAATTGDLGKLSAWAVSAAWGDLDHDGHLDLVVGCLRGPNRIFLGQGKGAFRDATADFGLLHQVHNSQAVDLLDLNDDGALDLVLANEGQDSLVFLGDPTRSGKLVSLAVRLEGKRGLVGARVEIQSADGKEVLARQTPGSKGRGGQAAPQARFVLPPGNYKVVVRLSDGQVRSMPAVLEAGLVRCIVRRDAEAGAPAAALSKN